jgi:hypothetical protein
LTVVWPFQSSSSQAFSQKIPPKVLQGPEMLGQMLSTLAEMDLPAKMYIKDQLSNTPPSVYSQSPLLRVTGTRTHPMRHKEVFFFP